jgi:hypothetical protein
MDQKIIDAILSKLHSDNEWGTYFLGRYYFTIATNKKRAECGLTKIRQELSSEVQLQLQYENFPALFHEYVHYLHEVSTVIGNASLSIDLREKAIFSNWLNPDSKAGTSEGLKPEYREKYAKALATQGVLLGDAKNVIKGRFLSVTEIDYIEQEVYFPDGNDFAEGRLNIPSMSFSQFVNGQSKTDKLLFGKYFIYEGLAYELDRLVDQQVKKLKSIDDDAKGSEYSVLKRVAQYIFPAIDRRTYLSLGVISLQYMNCGETFVKLVEHVKHQMENGIHTTDSLQEIKNEISSLLASKQQYFIEAQDEYIEIFENRRNLYRSFVYLTDQMKQLYNERIINPCFEVDYVFDGHFRDILDLAQICDYMYLFTDKNEYMRDFLGTSINFETSQSLKTIVCYDHFYKVHTFFPTSKIEEQEHKCPFYTCCDLKYRSTNQEICKTKPWRIFEIAANLDNKQCWYGGGVLEFKGQNER